MYEEIQKEFAPQFRETDLGFNLEYEKAYNSTEHYPEGKRYTAIPLHTITSPTRLRKLKTKD